MSSKPDFSAIPPKWFLNTKRGVGMAMVALGAMAPMVGSMVGVQIDPETVGEMGATLADWFDATWMVIGFGVWIVGSFFPTAPLSFVKQKDEG